jgi:hypothetical protein
MPRKRNPEKDAERSRKRQAKKNGNYVDNAVFDLGDMGDQQQQQFVFDEQPSPQPAPVPAPAPVPFAGWPPNLSEEEFFKRLNEEQSTEQPSQRLASSSGGLADQRVRALPNNLAAATYPALGQELSSTTDPATTPSLLSGGHQSLAATAGYDFDKEVDQFLIEEGWKCAAEMHNDMIEARYGKCSKEHHQLLLFSDPGAQQQMANFVAKSQAKVPSGPYNCKPIHQEYYGPYIRATIQTCPHCGNQVLWDRMRCPRVIAISKLPLQELWKAIIKDRSAREGSFVFQASGMCNIFQGENHCLHIDHVQMETARQNVVRRGHHSGRYGCWDPVPCIGAHVELHTLTAHELAYGQRTGHAR